jgi:hypothetical protein
MNQYLWISFQVVLINRVFIKLRGADRRQSKNTFHTSQRYSRKTYVCYFYTLNTEIRPNFHQTKRYIKVTADMSLFCQSQWTRGLRPGFGAARLLGLRVRIPPGAWMSVSCGCSVLSGRGLCVWLIPRLEESYRVCCVSECDHEASIIRRPSSGCCAIGRKTRKCRFNLSCAVFTNKVYAMSTLPAWILQINKKIRSHILCSYQEYGNGTHNLLAINPRPSSVALKVTFVPYNLKLQAWFWNQNGRLLFVKIGLNISSNKWYGLPFILKSLSVSLKRTEIPNMKYL